MPSTSSLSKADRTYRERSTGKYSFVLQDEDGNAIPLVNLDTITLTLTNVDDDSIINTRNDQDVKNANNVTIHATDGTVTWDIQRADNQIVGSLAHGEEETHRALFEYTWNGGLDADSHEVPIHVAALDEIP